jgi:hypothetical protein
LPRLAWNQNPSNLHLPRCWACRCEPSCSAFLYFYLHELEVFLQKKLKVLR